MEARLRKVELDLARAVAFQEGQVSVFNILSGAGSTRSSSAFGFRSGGTALALLATAAAAGGAAAFFFMRRR